MNSELEEKKRQNMERRREFIRRWAEYIRENPDKDWSRQQNIVINSQIRTASQEKNQRQEK